MSIASFLFILRLGLHDLLGHRRLISIMAGSIAIATAMVLFLVTYGAGLTAEFADPASHLLAVHDNQNVGDISGSRISNRVAGTLSGLGLSMIVPEIRALTGTNPQNVTILRGIDLHQYTRLESFSILSGRRLQPGDPARLAMVGTLLAHRQEVQVGGTISLRGRAFTVVGIFQNGTYMDNQAWISLADAQALLGWGDDVSMYIIPDEGILRAGDNLPGGLTITRKGESIRLIAAQYQPILNMWQIVAMALGFGASLTLANILWRLAWLRRREMAILRTSGFPTVSIFAYMLVQAFGITSAGILLGCLFMFILTLGLRLTVSGLTILPRLAAEVWLPGLGWVVLIMLAGILLPAWWLSRLNLAQLLLSK